MHERGETKKTLGDLPGVITDTGIVQAPEDKQAGYLQIDGRFGPEQLADGGALGRRTVARQSALFELQFAAQQHELAKAPQSAAASRGPILSVKPLPVAATQVPFEPDQTQLGTTVGPPLRAAPSRNDAESNFARINPHYGLNIIIFFGIRQNKNAALKTKIARRRWEGRR
jgi:hypothetical protein